MSAKAARMARAAAQKVAAMLDRLHDHGIDKDQVGWSFRETPGLANLGAGRGALSDCRVPAGRLCWRGQATPVARHVPRYVLCCVDSLDITHKLPLNPTHQMPAGH